MLGVDATAGAKVGQLHLVLHQQDVLRLDVTMENAVPVHVVYRLHELVHVVLDTLFWQVVATALDGVVHVHLHELEDEGQPAGRLVVEHLVEFNNLLMGR